MFCFKNGKRAYVGCVATAMAQIMAYFKHPKQIALFHQGFWPIRYCTLDWISINNLHSTYNDCDCSEHITQARLMREIGLRVGMTYGELKTSKGSSANMESAQDAYPDLGYKTGSYIGYDYNIVRQCLSRNQLIQMSGKQEGVADSGHSWVVDGYKEITNKAEEWGRTQTTTWRLLHTEVTTQRYIHCNWGWDGFYNGYFNNRVFYPNEIHIPNTSHTYNKLKIIPYIRPK